MSGPAGVLALVLAETAAGMAAFLFFTPLWGEVRRGFFFLTGTVAGLLALAAAGAGSAGFRAGGGGGDAGRLGAALSLAMALATLLWLVLLRFRVPGAGRVIGILTVPLSVAALIAFAPAAVESTGLAAVQLLAGAAFLGAVMGGLLLGHWYLTDRRLPRGPINRAAVILLGTIPVAAIAVIAGGFGPVGKTSASAGNALSPLLTVGGIAAWIALGMVAATGLIAVMIRLTLRELRPSAVQSATGFFYLAVITAITAELAAKVRFLP